MVLRRLALAIGCAVAFNAAALTESITMATRDYLAAANPEDTFPFAVTAAPA